jgi:hypothetical protein
MFIAGTQVYYVEIRQGSKVKRIVLPMEDGILDKLKAFLSEYPYLFHARQGEAQVTSHEVANPPAVIFDNLHFKADHIINATMYGHPDIPSGTLRYSAELIAAIQAMQPLKSQVVEEEVKPLTPDEELRLKLAGQQSEAAQQQEKSSVQTVAPAKEPVVIPPPAPSGEDQLRRQLEEAKQSRVFTPQAGAAGQVIPHTQQEAGSERKVSTYASVNDVIDILGRMSTKLDFVVAMSSLPAGNLTGKELSVWFAKSTVEHGYDKTFEILALKLQGKLE